MEKIKPLVLSNRSVLEELRGSFDDPVKTRQLASNLQHADTLLSYLTEIGIALAFQSLCREAIGDVLQVYTILFASILCEQLACFNNNSEWTKPTENSSGYSC